MVKGERIFIADKNTLDDVKADTTGILATMQDLDSKLKNIKRYGIKINKLDSNPNTRITYLYDAVGKNPAKMNFGTGVFDYGDWGNIWFVKNNYPVMVKYDGTEDYKLSLNDYTKKVDGTDSDITNLLYAGNAMATFPKVWISQYEVGNHEYIILCEERYDSTYKAYAHQRADGTLMDKIYLPLYSGYYDGTKLRSVSGVQPMNNTNAQTEINRAKANGSLWSIGTWSQRNLVNALLLVIGKSDNTQAVFGNGNLNYQAALAPTYGVMLTGALNTEGQFKGYNDNIHQVKVFHIEAWWADQWKRTLGIINDKGTIKTKMIPPYNLTGENYNNTGVTLPSISGSYIKNTIMGENGRIPKEFGGSSSTYLCDGFWINKDIAGIAIAGGSCGVGTLCGAFDLNLNAAASFTYWSVGASLSCEQPAT